MGRRVQHWGRPEGGDSRIAGTRGQSLGKVKCREMLEMSWTANKRHSDNF